MINRRNFITILLAVAFVVIVYFSVNRTQHGNPDLWIKEHGEVTERRGDPDRFCLDCHNKKFGHTKENFCNKCHISKNIDPVE
ncbi:hypothetical protein [Phosphitispora sp. TUW77]|uniref:hypothetical protein n=1 Tax=Phosphitispora sp. TUW77 TaxID=3152361 RepID=UPI003AB72728